MFDKLCQAHLHAHDWQQESLTFVPLRGSWFAQSDHSFNLEEEITKFLFSDKKVLLLLGDSGSGKSLYTQGLASKLWQDHKADSPIPVWISLPSLKNPVNRAIEETLERFGFNAEQVEALKQKNTFIFILDAFDEIHQLKNLWVSNHLDQWKAKIIITCRREYLYHVDNYKLYFIPFHGEKAVYQDYDEMIIKPFSEAQIEQYIKQYIQHQKPEWSLEQYQKALEETPGLKNLIKTPFLLKLAMEALPKMPQEKEQKYMTQAKLYDVFIEQWFIRQEQKLKLAKKIKEDEGIKPEFWDYAKRLAQLMHQQKTTLVTYDSSQFSDLLGEDDDNPWRKFFNTDNPRIELLRTACLVREVGVQQYAFVHNSLLEYFLTRELYENLLSKQQDVKVIQEAPKSPQLEVKKQDYFNERLLVGESNTLQFLADRVDEDEGFEKTLFDRVYASRNNSHKSISAANAITILNLARITFSGTDLSKIIIPNADLSFALLNNTNLSDSDLRGVKFTQAYLSGAILNNCKMDGVDFGQLPPLQQDKFVETFCCTSDGKYMAVASGEDIKMYDLQSRKIYKIFTGHQEDVFRLVLNSDDTLLASWSEEGIVMLWDVESTEGEELKGRYAKCIAFSPDGKFLAVGTNKNILVYDQKSKKLITSLQGHEDNINCVAFDSSSMKLASCSNDKSIRLWDVSALVPFGKPLLGHSEEVKKVVFNSNGKLLASCGEDGEIRIWEVETQQLIGVPLRGHLRYEVLCIAFSPDGKLLASGGGDQKFCVWEVSTFKLKFKQIAHSNVVTDVAFSPDGKMLITSGDTTVKFWSLYEENLLSQNLGGNSNFTLQKIIFSFNSELLAVKDSSGVLKFWDLKDKKLRGDNLKEIHDFIFSPDNKLIVSVSANTINFHDISSLKLISNVQISKEKQVEKINFSSDGKFLAILTNDRNIILWESFTRRVMDHPFEKFDEDILKVTFGCGKGGQLIIITTEKIYIWEILQKKANNIELSKKNHLFSISPNGLLIAIGNSNFDIDIWDLNSIKLVCQLQEKQSAYDSLTAMVFSSDNSLLATAGNRDGTIRLWEIKTQSLAMPPLIGHKDNVSHICFSSDSKLLVSACSSFEERAIKIWNLKRQDCLSTYNFPLMVLGVSFSTDGNYILIYGAENIAILQDQLNNNQYHLAWFFGLRNLVVDGIKLHNVQGLSETNKSLLLGYGAKQEQAVLEDSDLSDSDNSFENMTRKITEGLATGEMTMYDLMLLHRHHQQRHKSSSEEIIPIFEEDEIDKSNLFDSQNPHTFFQMPKEEVKEEKITSRPRCCVLL